MAGNKCEHILSNGERCEAWALEGRAKCFSHDESSKEQKAIAVQRGGASRQAVIETPLQQIVINTPADIVKLLSVTITEVRDGTLDPRIANTIGFLAGHLVRAFELAVVDNKTEAVKELLTHKASTTVIKRGLL